MQLTIKQNINAIFTRVFLGVVLGGAIFFSLIACSSPVRGNKGAEAIVEMVDSGISYKESTAQLRNPARGPSLDPGNFGQLTNLSGMLSQISHTNTYQYTVQRFYINLSDYINVPIPEIALNNLDLALAEARRLEITVIMAFQYHGHYPCDCAGHCIYEPVLDIIFGHIDQICKVLAKYPDVLLLVKSSMLGPWGEQHSTPLARGTTNGVSNIALLVKQWLDCTKKYGLQDIQISVRTPKGYLDWYNYRFGTNFLSVAQTLHSKGTDAYRMGIWNDAYMSNSNDSYTFADRDIEMEWLNKKASYTFYGGEPGNASLNEWSALPLMEPAAYKTRASFLRDGTGMSSRWENIIYNGVNSVYNNTTITVVGYQWQSTATRKATVWDWLRLHLGYRFVVRKSLISEKIVSGGNIRLAGMIENVGFAPILVATKASIIIASDNTNLYEMPVNIDLNSGKYDVTVSLPSALTDGQYTVYLKVWRDKSGTPNDTSNEIIAFANNGEFPHSLFHNNATYATGNNIIFNSAPGIRANKLAAFSISGDKVLIDKP